MTREEVLKGIRDRFAAGIVALFDKSPKRVYVEISADTLIPLATHIFKEIGARFHIATGVDARTHLEILYHFSVEALNLLISLRVKMDKSNPTVPSLAPVIKGTNWIEREIHELLGVDFTGHPDLRRLLLADAWPKDVFPLRTDYREWDKEAIRDRGV